MTETDLAFEVSARIGTVSGILLAPEKPRAALALAHGAGAGMRHTFLASLASALAERAMATLRFQFPYVQAGGRRPDPPALLHATVRAAVAEVSRRLPDLPLYAGGKSMGGRMTSQAQAEEPLAGVRKIVFVGFPLHPAGAPSIDRAAHLDEVRIPMLFLQGTRDALADMSLMRPVCAGLGTRATMHVVEGADHSFKVLKSLRRGDDDVMAELADAIARFAEVL